MIFVLELAERKITVYPAIAELSTTTTTFLNQDYSNEIYTRCYCKPNLTFRQDSLHVVIQEGLSLSRAPGSMTFIAATNLITKTVFPFLQEFLPSV